MTSTIITLGLLVAFAGTGSVVLFAAGVLCGAGMANAIRGQEQPVRRYQIYHSYGDDDDGFGDEDGIPEDEEDDDWKRKVGIK